MKKLLLALSLLLPLCAAAQRHYLTDEAQKDSLRTYMIHCAQTSAKINYSRNNHYLHSNNLSDRFASQINTTNLTLPQRAAMQYIQDLYKGIGTSTAVAIYDRDMETMPMFLEYDSTQTVLVLNEFYYQHNTFNTLATNPMIRAASVIVQSVNPAFINIAPYITDNYPYIGLVVAWSSRNFAQQSPTPDYFGDCLLTIAPISAIRDYYDLRITEKEFSSLCDYYLVDYSTLRMRRIELDIYEEYGKIY